MAWVVEISPVQSEAAHLVRSRILGMGDNHWRQLPMDVGRRKYCADMYKVGRWGRGGPRSPSPNECIIGGESNPAGFLYLEGFFPVHAGKTGGGREVHSSRPGDTTRITWRITFGESPLASLPKWEKFRMAFCLACAEVNWEAFGQQFKQLLTWEGLGMMGSFFMLELKNNPTKQFKVLQACARKVLFWYSVYDYCSQIDNLLTRIEMADDADSMQQAGKQFADFLMAAAMDLSMEVLTQFIQRARKIPDGSSQAPGMPGHAQPIPKMPVPQHWRDGQKAFRNHASTLIEMANEALRKGNLRQYGSLLAAAARAQIQAFLFAMNAIEVVHHADSMRQLSQPASAIAQQISRILSVPTSKEVHRKNIMKYLIDHTRKSGLELTEVEAAQIADYCIKENGMKPLPTNLDWTHHDVENFPGSKLNTEIANGMKEPIDTRTWTLNGKPVSVDQLEMLARGINPDTGKKLTHYEFRKIVGGREASKRLMEMYGGFRDIFSAGIRAKGSIDAHNCCMGHHNPQNLNEWMEKGHDVAHAFIQKRGYRPEAWPVDKVMNEISNFGQVESRAWIKLGFASCKSVDPSLKKFVEPLENVDRSTLLQYHQTELADELFPAKYEPWTFNSSVVPWMVINRRVQETKKPKSVQNVGRAFPR